MKRRLPLLMLPVLVVACTSPRDQCLTQATQQYRGLQTAIAEAEANVQRGYAINRQAVTYNSPTFCLGVGTGYYNRGIGGGVFGCSNTRTRIIEEPVPIDVNEERRKLASMRKLLPDSQARAQAGIGVCEARYPT